VVQYIKGLHYTLCERQTRLLTEKQIKLTFCEQDKGGRKWCGFNEVYLCYGAHIRHQYLLV
jgi:hypothetical protein